MGIKEYNGVNMGAVVVEPLSVPWSSPTIYTKLEWAGGTLPSSVQQNNSLPVKFKVLFSSDVSSGFQDDVYVLLSNGQNVSMKQAIYMQSMVVSSYLTSELDVYGQVPSLSLPIKPDGYTDLVPYDTSNASREEYVYVYASIGSVLISYPNSSGGYDQVTIMGSEYTSFPDNKIQMYPHRERDIIVTNPYFQSTSIDPIKVEIGSHPNITWDLEIFQKIPGRPNVPSQEGRLYYTIFVNGGVKRDTYVELSGTGGKVSISTDAFYEEGKMSKYSLAVRLDPQNTGGSPVGGNDPSPPSLNGIRLGYIGDNSRINTTRGGR